MNGISHDCTTWREGGGVDAWAEGNSVIGHLYFFIFLYFFDFFHGIRGMAETYRNLTAEWKKHLGAKHTGN